MAIPALFTFLNVLLLVALIWRLRDQFGEVLQWLAGLAIMLVPVLMLIVLIVILGYAGFTIAIYFSVILMAVGIFLFQKLRQQHLARVLGGAITLLVANAMHGFMLVNYWLLLQQYA